MPTARISRVPGMPKTIELAPGASINDALAAAGIKLEANERLTMNGAPIDSSELGSRAVDDGATILLTRQIKGNVPVTVRVSRVPGVPVDVVVDDMNTVRDVLRIANITLAGNERISLGDTVADLNQRITQGASILITKTVKGNT